MTALPERLGKYRIIRELGQGAMGAVYLAMDSEAGREIALKILKQDLQIDTTHLKRFMREAHTGQQLQHPHIMQIHQCGRVEGRFFIDMEFVRGRDLKEVINEERQLPVGAVLGIACRMASALRCAHEAGIIHRDIKPGNIFLGAGGLVKLGDFGLARHADGSDMVTMAQEPIGTPAYMPREQITCENVDIRSDIYSLGATLYHALAGRAPFADCRSLTELLLAQVERPVPPLPAYAKFRCEPFCDLIMRMLAKDPGERPQEPGELQLALEKCKSGYKAHADLLTASLARDAQGAGPTLQLQIKSPQRRPETRTVPIVPLMSFGRGESNHVCLYDPYVSRQGHAYIEVREHDLYLVQNPGKKKIDLNGEPVSPKGVLLQVGDRIRIGGTTVVIEASEVVSKDAIDETIERLVAEAEAVDYGALAESKKREKERLLAEAQRQYDSNRPWHGSLGHFFLRRTGKATLAAAEFLTSRGVSAPESERLVREMKGERANHFEREDVTRERSDFCGMLLGDSEITLVIPAPIYEMRIRNYAWGEIIRYGDQDWYPVKKREIEGSVFIWMRKC